MKKRYLFLTFGIALILGCSSCGKKTKNYTITFKSGDTVLETDKVKKNNVPTYDGTTPSKEATSEFTYTFDGWDTEINEATEDKTYVAKFKATTNKYTVTWVNDDNTELEKDTDVLYGSMPSFGGSIPTKASSAEASYTFNGWDKTISSVTGNITYKAMYTETKNKYTVTWLNDDNSILKVTEGNYGTTPSFGDVDPVKASTEKYSYEFSGWDKTISTITSDVTYKAVYTSSLNKYTATFLDTDGNVLSTTNINYGETPVYTGDEPNKASTIEYVYLFDEWTTNKNVLIDGTTYTIKHDGILPISGNTTYTPSFNALKTSTYNDATFIFNYNATTETYNIVYPNNNPAYFDDIVIGDIYDDGVNGVHPITGLNSAFLGGADSLKSLYLGENISSLPSNFLPTDSDSFKTLIVSKDNQYYTSVNNIIYSKDLKTLVRVPSGYTGDFRIEDTITKVSENAFMNVSIDTLYFGPNTKSFGFFVFSDAITNVYFNGTISDWAKINFCDYTNYSHNSASNPATKTSNLYLLDNFGEYSKPSILLVLDENVTSLYEFSITGTGFDDIDFVKILGNVETINLYSINLKNMTAIFLPTSITLVKFSALNYDALTEIHFAGTEEQFDSITFEEALPSSVTITYNEVEY